MKKLKILKFKQGKVLDLNDNPEFGCNVIECGKDRFTLREFKEQVGHDDSLPYVGILYINEHPICRCFNDGWGGQTEMTPLDATSRALMYSVASKLTKYRWTFGKMTFGLTMDFIADTLACSLANGF